MNLLESLPTVRDVTVGPDGTIMGRREIGENMMRFISPLDLYWIEATWNAAPHGARGRLCQEADGLGAPGVVPPRLDYLPSIRASSYRARRTMLDIVRTYITDARMADHLGLDIVTLRTIVAEAYRPQ